MTRILVTGMSGTGKSTLLADLARRGHTTVETDVDGWTTAEGLWDEPRITALLDAHASLVIAGTVENQGSFRDRFDHVVLLTAPSDIIMRRLSERTNNPYGKTADQKAEILGYIETVEPLLFRSASLVIDTARHAPPQIADAVEQLLTS